MMRVAINFALGIICFGTVSVAEEVATSKIEFGRFTSITDAHFLPLRTEVVLLGILENDESGKLCYSQRRGAPEEALALIEGIDDAETEALKKYLGRSALFVAEIEKYQVIGEDGSIISRCVLLVKKISLFRSHGAKKH